LLAGAPVSALVGRQIRRYAKPAGPLTDSLISTLAVGTSLFFYLAARNYSLFKKRPIRRRRLAAAKKNNVFGVNLGEDPYNPVLFLGFARWAAPSPIKGARCFGARARTICLRHGGRDNRRPPARRHDGHLGCGSGPPSSFGGVIAGGDGPVLLCTLVQRAHIPRKKHFFQASRIRRHFPVYCGSAGPLRGHPIRARSRGGRVTGGCAKDLRHRYRWEATGSHTLIGRDLSHPLFSSPRTGRSGTMAGSAGSGPRTLREKALNPAAEKDRSRGSQDRAPHLRQRGNG